MRLGARMPPSRPPRSPRYAARDTSARARAFLFFTGSSLVSREGTYYFPLGFFHQSSVECNFFINFTSLTVLKEKIDCCSKLDRQIKYGIAFLIGFFCLLQPIVGCVSLPAVSVQNFDWLTQSKTTNLKYYAIFNHLICCDNQSFLSVQELWEKCLEQIFEKILISIRILIRPFSNYSSKKYRCEFSTAQCPYNIILIILISITFRFCHNRYLSKQILICDVITQLNAHFFSF